MPDMRTDPISTESESLDLQDDDGNIKERLLIALDTVKAEYEGEHTRAGSYEGRAGILITLAGALLVFVGQSFHAPKSHVVPFILMQCITIIAIIVSMFSMTKVLYLRTFFRVNYKQFMDSYFLCQDSEEAIARALQSYDEAIQRTEKAISIRTRWFNRGIWFLFGSLVLTVSTQMIILYTG